METLEVNFGKHNIVLMRDLYVWGDGGHETTEHCLHILDGMKLEGKRVLDIGTGTGILAIYAALKGAKSVFAVDLDVHACEYARKNFRLNGVKDRCEVEVNDLCKGIGEAYDVVIANLPINEHLELDGYLPEVVAEGTEIVTTWWRQFDVRHFDPLGHEVILRREGSDWDGYLLRVGG